MKALNFTNFLESGALLRVAPSQWFLLEGPFRAQTSVNRREVALFVPDFFFDSEQNYWIPESFYRLTDDQLRSYCIEANPGLLTQLPWEPADLQSFTASYNAILEKIQEGSLKKAVPVVFEKSSESVRTSHLVSMILSLLQAPPTLYVFGFWQGGQGVLGATPEVLLQQKGQDLKTMALAGTCPKSEATQRESLLKDAKERYEHDLVVQDIVHSLSLYGDLQTQGPQILELPTLFHLKTDIQCQLKDAKNFSFFEACASLHPTPALGVSPRDFGYDWMRNLPEQKTRQGFGAPWGLQWSEDEALCLVAIRNLQWNREEARIGSGCGIVAQSDLQQEWRELSQKRASVKNILGLES